MAQRWRTDAAVMAGIVAAFCVVSVLAGERIGINGGQGWDGMAYTAWAEDFWQRVIVEHLTRYHSQRVLPSAIVHYGLRITGRPSDAAHAIAGFQVLNSAMLVIAAGLWAHLGAAMSWRRPARWVGFIALFASFANARHALYYPTLADPMAFALGMVLAWGYLTDRPWAIWLAGALGTLTWPALPPIAIALLILPRSRASVSSSHGLERHRLHEPVAPHEPAPPREPVAPREPTAPHEPVAPREPVAPHEAKRAPVIAAVLAAAGTAAFLVVAWHYLRHPVPGVGDEKFAQWVRRDLLILTVPGLVAMLGIGAYLLLRDPRLFQLRSYLGPLPRRRWIWIAAAIAALIALRIAWVGAIGTRGEGPTGAQFLCEHTLAALRGPVWGPVHHVVYFGPIIAVAALFWHRLARTANDFGPGAVLVLGVTLAFAAGSQSRQRIHLVPFLVAVTIAATEPVWTPRRALCFAALALAWSKLWLTIGYDRHATWWQFPEQRYFMHQGPWASDAMYLVHLVAALVSALVLGWILVGRSPQCRSSPELEPDADASPGPRDVPPG